MPQIQAKLIERVGDDKIARNIDGDEAAVLGSVLHGASVSAQFKLGVQVRIKDLNLVPVQIAYDTESIGILLLILGSATVRNLKTILFNEQSNLGSKKLMTFKRNKDFEFTIDYKYNVLD